MTQVDLLTAVQPPDGWFAVLGLKDGAPVRQTLVYTREEFDEVAAQYVAQERNVYFAVAKYATDANRTKANVLGLKSFWLDIDCGPTKAVVNEKTKRPNGYIDQAEGIKELKRFCKLIGLPKPLIVNSGRGLHVYWPLEQVISREEWEPVAKRLQHLCFLHNFYIDAAVFEVARVLRVPGTFNYKDDPPTQVEVLQDAPPTNFEAFRKLLGAKEASTISFSPGRELTELGKALRDNIEYSFARIMRKSAKGEGCAQLMYAYTNQNDISEPQWFNALSTAKFCKDSASAIHKMSDAYEGYDPVATEKKISHIAGPHNCATFERDNPGGCDGCKFKGVITNPILLGKDIKEASLKDNIVTEIVEDDEGNLESETYVIPTYPKPYFRGANGGIYRKPFEEEGEPILILEEDFYVVKRMRDPVEKDVIIMRLHKPKDGIAELKIPVAKSADVTELRSILAGESIVMGRKRFELLIEYIFIAINTLKNEKRSELMRTQFGWADRDTKFIVGDQEVTVQGTYHSPPSTITSKVVPFLRPVGSFDKWREVFSLYGRPGLEPHAFAALTAFGAPLFKFFGQSGAMINVIHPTSGTGKTTILHMCNSVWGSPKGLLAVAEDTLNGKIMRLGMYNNLPYTVDEITNTSPMDFSTLVYNITQGRGKDRVKQSANELRDNLTSWSTIALCSSNSSFHEKMTTAKTSPDGEMMRLVEYKIEACDAVDAALGKHMFDHQLLENYGHAGLVYAEFLVNNLKFCIDTCLDVQSKIDKALNLTQRERFWSAVVAANIAGGLLAQSIGLIDWDMVSIYKWSKTMIQDMRRESAPPMLDVTAIIGDYINRHMQNILVVKGNADRRSSMPTLPSMEPRGELLIRWEPDTKLLFLTVKGFQSDCAKHQVNYRDTVKRLTAEGIFIKNDNKRMSKGMKISSPGVACLILDGSKEDFINMDNVVKVGDTDADSGEG